MRVLFEYLIYLVAAAGAVGHFALGAQIFLLPMLVVVAACRVGAVLAARFANGCEIHRLNCTVGITLLAPGAVTLGIKLFL